ncbi:Rpn family recombination-promoting nuclease/putative transposase [Scytonema sp. NUACC26]|uniref:Rpn family recombination-promoting nuclease/putative transposase n=1 Tax=Scytonema sp. NUACC26 TaxID=3140176 RepID=UPI0034DCB7C0
MTDKNPPTAYDSPWKDILQIYFEEFILFFLPNEHIYVDWTKPIEFLDKELEEVVKDAEIGRRFADKLVKIYLTNGAEEWVLIHVEVQAQEDSDFPERMYVYSSRIYSKYKKKVVSIAVLGDDNPNWKPSQFGYSLFGYRLNVEYPVIKLLDYQQQQSQLSASNNPFAIVVLAHLAALNTRSDRTLRKQEKLALVQRLYSMEFEEQDILNLFAFLDWMLTLPLDLEAEFKQEIKQLEVRQAMKYVTSVERSGIEIGKKEHAVSLIVRQLNRRVGNVDDTIVNHLRGLSVEELDTLGEALLDFTSMADLTNWLEQQ